MSWSFIVQRPRVSSHMLRLQIERSYGNLASAKFLKKSMKSVNKVSLNTDLALNHFDSLYGKVYGRAWPSMRLGLLSPKKQCAVLNSFVDTCEPHDQLEEEKAIDLQRYYKKHLQSYTRILLRQQILTNKRVRKRELIAKNENKDAKSIDLNSIEVSDVSDSELRGAQTSDESDRFSSAEDLQEMFSDRRLDDDEKYFINQASTKLSMNDYVPATEYIHHEEIANDLAYYQGFSQDLELSIDHKDEPYLELDEHLKVYTFPRRSWSKFPPPSIVPKADLMTYYLLDGASILPVLALDLRVNEVCADYCAAPGGKSLAILMTLKPKYLLCNDSSISRLNRLNRVIKQYAPDISYIKSTLAITNHDARSLIKYDTFDKILVDAPCSNDRHSIETLDNNIFKRSRSEERLQLPLNQCDILKSALKSLKPNGAVVYSTCSMSPVENDGVVQRALLQLQEEDFESKFTVMSLKETFRPLRGLFKFVTNFKYGQQVVPNICSNFGPMYISKIKRLS